MTVHHVQDLSFRQEHELVVYLIDGTNLQGQNEAVAAPNIVHPEVESKGTGRPLVRR